MGRTASKKKAAAKARATTEADKNDGEVECVCGLCCEPVKDEEDEGRGSTVKVLAPSGFTATALE